MTTLLAKWDTWVIFKTLLSCPIKVTKFVFSKQIYACRSLGLRIHLTGNMMSGKPKGHFWLCIISHAKSQASLERAKLFGIRGILCYYCRSYCDRAKPGLSQKSTWKLLCLWWLMSHPITSAMSTFNAFVLLAMAMIYARETSFISWSSSSRKLLYEEFWSYDAANEASFYIFFSSFFVLVLTILTSSMLEKLRTKMLTWTRVAESVRKKTSLQAL